jgi:hypothetical protein
MSSGVLRLYVDVIIRRYEVATGDPAVLVETGGKPSRRWALVGERAAPV